VTKRTLITGGFEAEFFVDHKSVSPLYHFIITRKGNADIIMWGQEHTMEEAERTALEWMTVAAHSAVASAG
jgi:hypothetical protein